MTVDGQIEVTVAALAPDVGYGAAPFTYGVGRPLRGPSPTGGWPDEARVLSPLPHGASGSVRVERSQCIRLPDRLDSRRALAVPMLATALWAWEQLDLELGEAAVYTTGSPLERMIACVARWRGALPVVRLGSESTETVDGVRNIGMSDPQSAIRELSDAVRAAPGFAAVDLSGRGEIFDVLLEVLPRWGRVLLGAPTSSLVTVDFYNNVHRKGAYLRTARLDPMLVFDPALREDRSGYVERAVRILGNDELARACLLDD